MEISFKTTNNIWKVKLEKFTLSGGWMENKWFSEHRGRLDNAHQNLKKCRLERATPSLIILLKK